MPTVLRIGAARVHIFTHDHAPAHVHVLSRDCEAVYDLNCPDGPMGLRENKGCRLADTRRLSTALADHVRMLCEAWGAIHDHR